jgi:NCS2 family nucleobase:cation symporter-2
MTCALSVGVGAILVPNWFSYFFTYSGTNTALAGFLDAITLLMEAGYALAGVIALILHLILPEESEKDELVEAAAVAERDRKLENATLTATPVLHTKNSLNSDENGISKLD